MSPGPLNHITSRTALTSMLLFSTDSKHSTAGTVWGQANKDLIGPGQLARSPTLCSKAIGQIASLHLITQPGTLDIMDKKSQAGHSVTWTTTQQPQQMTAGSYETASAYLLQLLLEV